MVNIGSILSTHPSAGGTIYSATKWTFHNFT
ncbi:hypothetical protein [Sphingobium sp. BS19]